MKLCEEQLLVSLDIVNVDYATNIRMVVPNYPLFHIHFYLNQQ